MQPKNGTPTGDITQQAYHSNPFTNLAHQLLFTLRYNPISTITNVLLTFLAFFAVAVAFGFMTALLGNIPIVNIIVFLALYAALAYVLLYFTTAAIYLQVASREGKSVTARQALEDVKKRNFTETMLAQLLSYVLVGLGIVVLILPGIYLIGRVMLAPYIAMVEGLKPVDAVKRSWNLTKGHWLETLSTLIAQNIALGGMGFGGVNAGLAGRYYEYVALEKAQQPAPKTHWMNYFLPIAVIGFGALYALLVAIGFSAVNNLETKCMSAEYYYARECIEYRFNNNSDNNPRDSWRELRDNGRGSW